MTQIKQNCPLCVRVKNLSSLSLLMLAYPVTRCLTLRKVSRREKDLQYTPSYMRGFMKSCHFLKEIHWFYARPSITRHIFYASRRRTFFYVHVWYMYRCKRSNINILSIYVFENWSIFLKIIFAIFVGFFFTQTEC